MTSKINSEKFRDFYQIREVPLKGIKDFKGQLIEKILRFWRLKGLVPFMEKGQWAKISFAELIWLRILDSLREFNTPIEKMKLVCTYLFEDSYKDNLPEKYLRDSIKILEANENKSKLEEDFLNARKNILENHKVLLELLKSDINYLTNLIHICLNERMECGIAIFSDYTISEVYDGNFIPHNNLEINSKKPHIYLSMRYYLQEFIHDEDLSFELGQILNESEVYVLNQLKNKNINEINIQFNKGNMRIESSSLKTINKEDAGKIKEALGLNNYERITVNTRDGNSLSFKRTKLKLIDSD